MVLFPYPAEIPNQVMQRGFEFLIGDHSRSATGVAPKRIESQQRLMRRTLIRISLETDAALRLLQVTDFHEAKPVSIHGRACTASIRCRQQRRQVRPIHRTMAHLDESSGEDANHVHQKPVAVEEKIHHAVPLFDPGVEKGADRGFLHGLEGGERPEIMGSYEAVQRLTHRCQIEPHCDMERGVVQKNVMKGTVPDPVSIDLAGSLVPRVEPLLDLCASANDYILRQVFVAVGDNIIGRQHTARVEVGNLALGVRARVGSGGADHGDRFSGHPREHSLQLALDRTLGTPLALPPQVAPAVVLNGDPNVSLTLRHEEIPLRTLRAPMAARGAGHPFR